MFTSAFKSLEENPLTCYFYGIKRDFQIFYIAGYFFSENLLYGDAINIVFLYM